MILQHLKPLTSLRFVFSMMVFFSHLNFLKNSESNFSRHLYNTFFAEGYIGVSFFFVLSGFILAYNYFDRIFLKKISYIDFLISRISRIFPLHFLTLLISIPLVISIYSDNFLTMESILQIPIFFFNTFLIQSFIPIKGVYFSFNSVSWSISNELFFYVMTPLLFIKFNKLKIKEKLIKSSIIIFLTVFIGIQFAPEIYHHQIFYINPLLRIFDFILGIILYLIFKKYSLINKNTFFYSSIKEFASILILLLFVYFSSDVPQVYRYSIYYWLPMSFIIFTFSFSLGIVSQILSNKIFLYLGEISFGFYLFHHLVINYYELFTSYFNLVLNEFISSFICFIISLFLSIISFEYFENKIKIKFKSFLLSKKEYINFTLLKFKTFKT